MLNLIFIIYLAILLGVSIAGFIRYKKLNKAFQFLTIVILCTLISESIKKVYGKVYLNSMPLAHLWAVIEFAMYSLVYYYLLKSIFAKKTVLILIALMTLLEVVNLLYFEKISQFPSIILEAS